MHETAKRLLRIGIHRGAKDFSEIARRLGASDQSATNWKKRGVPQKEIVKAASLFGVDPLWLSADPRGVQAGGNLLDLALVRSKHREVAQDDKEDVLLRGYRDASDELREILLMQARLATEKKQLFSERNETK